jgi:hypothetical protein
MSIPYFYLYCCDKLGNHHLYLNYDKELDSFLECSGWNRAKSGAIHSYGGHIEERDFIRFLSSLRRFLKSDMYQGASFLYGFGHQGEILKYLTDC